MMATFDELSAEAERRFSDRALEALEITPGYRAFFKAEYLGRRSFGAALFGGDFRDANSAISRLCVERGITALSCAGLDCQATYPSFIFQPSHATLACVRERYHTPSYVISDDFETFAIVSDSDYFWGIAAQNQIVSRIMRENEALLLGEDDIEPYLKSSDPHDRKIGGLLTSYSGICERATGRRR